MNLFLCTVLSFQVAARTLGDLVRKLGERVLPEIIPILERGLDSDKSDERQGVCIGLSEIVSSTSKEQVTKDTHYNNYRLTGFKEALLNLFLGWGQHVIHAVVNSQTNCGPNIPSLIYNFCCYPPCIPLSRPMFPRPCTCYQTLTSQQVHFIITLVITGNTVCRFPDTHGALCFDRPVA